MAKINLTKIVDANQASGRAYLELGRLASGLQRRGFTPAEASEIASGAYVRSPAEAEAEAERKVRTKFNEKRTAREALTDAGLPTDAFDAKNGPLGLIQEDVAVEKARSAARARVTGKNLTVVGAAVVLGD